ncbi:hypothetical protein ISN45_At03g025230 [Arabidopsis thaliana x Arabidopsis arenosa]|uniref:Uncharacterized protein n=1 Tax=Arabidopsis thaliana x Arabidopsis arenosa TaxID=1240361 RepID=A0A8T2EQU3_9BRAS|nr:hypothetical protein ISN45_At03g025230 [Arabidopsis thaliana x Arabidopsis arenosa]
MAGASVAATTLKGDTSLLAGGAIRGAINAFGKDKKLKTQLASSGKLYGKYAKAASKIENLVLGGENISLVVDPP